MSLHEEIKGQIKEAMMAKDAVRLTTLRGLVSAFTNELVATQRKPQDFLNDEEVLAVIRRNVKQRKDSIEQFTSGGRPDLAESEQAELLVLEKFLPQMMSRDDIKAVVEAKKAELGIDDKSKQGLLMKAVMTELKGKADGSDVKAVVEGLFS
ncbi:MAG: GatB/YqeY domain-containing protein [bacterium]